MGEPINCIKIDRKVCLGTRELCMSGCGNLKINKGLLMLEQKSKTIAEVNLCLVAWSPLYEFYFELDENKCSYWLQTNFKDLLGTISQVLTVESVFKFNLCFAAN